MKRIYEILDECKLQETVDGILTILGNNDTPALRSILQYTYDPYFQWTVSEFPTEYKRPDTLPGISQTNMYTELRRIYLFQKGHPVADKIEPEKRNKLLMQLLEGMEFDDAQVFINILKKDLGIDGLDKDSINRLYPGLIN